MGEWEYQPDDGGSGESWQLVIPNERLYHLWPMTSDDYVNAEGVKHWGVAWVLDYSEMDGDDIKSHRYVTADGFELAAAQEWALKTGGV